MGRVVLDPADEHLDSKLHALEHRARLFGSSVVKLEYPGMPVQVFVGTNHAYQRKAAIGGHNERDQEN